MDQLLSGDTRPQGLQFVSAALLLLLLITVYPVVFGLIVSFSDWNWGSEGRFIGLANYKELLTSAEFWQVLRNTLIFAAVGTTIEVALGCYLAVQVDKVLLFHQFIRTVLLLPMMVSGIVVALMSKVMFDPFVGVVNYFLSLAGQAPSAFYGEAKSAMPSVILVDVWWQTGFIFIVVLAGLKSVPRDLVEAARVDGAGRLRTFWKVHFPHISGVLVTVVSIRVIDTLKIFDLIFGTTGGGPGLATEVVQTYAYRNAFSFQLIGKSMALMVLFALLILTLVGLVRLWGRRGTHG